jgi:hypothetical protein
MRLVLGCPAREGGQDMAVDAGTPLLSLWVSLSVLSLPSSLGSGPVLATPITPIPPDSEGSQWPGACEQVRDLTGVWVSSVPMS